MNGLSHRSAVGADRLADAELQADVMRFVAILALCLVGISTLVERAGQVTAPVPQVPSSAPAGVAAPAPQDDQAVAVVPAVIPLAAAIASPVPPDRANNSSTQTEPASSPPSPIGLPVVGDAGSVTYPETREETTVATPATEAPRSDRKGLTLRFESDAALLRMVGRGEAGVFVLDGRRVLALDIRRGVDFRPAPSPSRMHVITSETVPALLRAEYDGPPGATWGVTLPGATLEAMRPHVEREDQGVLVIAEDGTVRLEADDV